MGDQEDRAAFPAVDSRLSVHLRAREQAAGPRPIVLTPEDDAEPATIEADPRTGQPKAGSQRYVRLGELGHGGMGTVYNVLDTDLHRRLALKVIRGQPGGGPVSPEFLERFLAEAQITGQLDHPGIVPLHDIGVDARGNVYFTMRLVKGRHLGEVMKLARTGAEGWSRDRILPLLIKVCEAMAYAHSKGVVHRDLKPENVMVGRFGEAYVMDWGLAKVIGRRDVTAPPVQDERGTQAFVLTDRGRPDSGSGRETMQGTVVGTVSFMPPEQARGDVDRIDGRTDVYAFGAILYDLLAGQAPYEAPGARVSPHTMLRWVIDGPPKPVREIAPDAAPDLAAICEKCMAREPGDRYPEMLAVAEDLRAFLRGRPVSANPLGRVARTARWCRRSPIVTAFLVTLVVGAGFALWSLSDLATFLVRQSAMDSARMEAAVLEDVNALYSSDVVARVDREHVTVTHDYLARDGAIPIPATFLTVLGARISAQDSGMRVRHYSDLPFRSRPDGGPKDEFGRTAMAELRADPSKPVVRFEDLNGQATVRYATARRMKESCVACHNTHPDSPKTDWKAGDVRGVLEIIRPLDRDVERTRAGLRGTLSVLGGLAVLLFAFAGFVLVQQHRAEARGAGR